MSEEKQTKTGTTTIGIVCKDGIVLAADKRATAGFIVNKKVKKIAQISDYAVVTVAGTVSDIQLLVKLVGAELKLKDLQSGRSSNIKESANLLAGLVYSNFRKMSMIPGITSFLLAGKDAYGVHLYDIGVDGSALEVDDYVSDGSGSIFAIGALEANYKKGLSVDEGVKLVVKAVNAALQRDPGSGNGIDIYTITDKGVQQVLQKELVAVLEI
jgi:proteasome beta subunit